ncbi:MAG: hypoxanthine phosphoribosyltransferase [Calditrichaeota bacterium]|nr:MAG: hypoxanthine phosphoribosyltransferase [Calditrichota bacterium]MBL1207597.1 hypoxanthine phosphoribosyltransferase [Calditrichota bacterium]NOG47430.1 hypoxanthine phosphoribosyltransferase [Calditrichota bacterium]
MNNHSQKSIIPDNYSVLISEAEIEQRLETLGKEIAQDFKGTTPILIGVLNGGFIFLADLIRHINIDLEIDFIRISSYGNQRESTGHVKVLKPLSADIAGRHVIVVEDIVDSGLSVKFLNNMMSAFNPARLKFASLLHKPSKTVADIKLDYVGFEIEDKYVVGYGLDDQQIKRNLRDIFVIQV